MEVIIFESSAYYAMIQEIVRQIKLEQKITEDKWISGAEAMKKLRITSRSTLYKLRIEGKIKYSAPEKKIILYDSDSINDFLEKHSKETF